MEGGSAPPEEAAPSVKKFEEYRFFSESTARLSDRRQLTTQVWVTLRLFCSLHWGS